MELNKYDIFIEKKYHWLIEKLIKKPKLSNIYLGRYFGIETNDKSLKDEKENKSMVKCFVSKQKGFEKYIHKDRIIKDCDFWKVITARANGREYDGFGNIFIGTPHQVYSGSYISFKVETEEEAKSLVSYLKCKLTNILLCLRKISQDISEGTCKWIPLPPLNKIWTDKKLFKYYKFDKKQIRFVSEETMKGF